MTSITARTLLLAAVALIVVGVLAFVLQPGEPDSVCAPDGAPTSGFVDTEKDCGITQESFNEIADYRSSPKPFRIAGLVLVLAGVGTGVASLVVARKDRKADDTPADPAA
jgi:hypothetical protein